MNPFFNYRIKPLIALCIAATALGCASGQVKVSTDPNKEIASLDVEQERGKSEQFYLLAPKSWTDFSDALGEAKSRRSNGKDAASILEKTKDARSAFAQAESKSKIAKVTLNGVLAARNDAITAGADKFANADFMQTDRDLLKATKDIERGQTGPAEKQKGEFSARYHALEIRGIRHANLDPSQTILDDARKEGAEKWAPKTFTDAHSKLKATEDLIVQNPKDTAAIQRASDEALQASNRALQVTRQSKVTSAQHPEEMVLKLEEQQKTVAALSSEKQATEQALSEKEKVVSSLETEKQFNDRFTKIRARFSEGEADVLRDGNNLVIRMKGLHFPTAQSTIPSSDFALLAKLDEVIKEFGPTNVKVEGHTDALGSEKKNRDLSAARAESVKEFLTSKGTLPQDKVNVVGMGSEKPIATNKTAAGRAENRRVDVILETERG